MVVYSDLALAKTDTLLSLNPNYVFRYDECFKNVQKFLYSNQFGSLIEVDCYCGSWLPDWRANQDYSKSVSSNKKLGGGVLLELSHEIDFINYLLGPIKINFASKFNSELLNIDVEDNAFIYASSNKCKSIKISLNFCTNPKERYVKFQFANGILIWDLIEQVVLIKDYGGKKTIFYKSPFTYDHKYKMELKNFFKFSSYKEETLSDLDNSLKTIQLHQKLSMVNFAKVIFPTDTEILIVLKAGLRGPRKAIDFVSEISEDRQLFVLRSLVWFVKLGILREVVS